MCLFIAAAMTAAFLLLARILRLPGSSAMLSAARPLPLR